MVCLVVLLVFFHERDSLLYFVRCSLFLGCLRIRRIQAALEHPTPSMTKQGQVAYVQDAKIACQDAYVPLINRQRNETDGRKQERPLREFYVESN